MEFSIKQGENLNFVITIQDKALLELSPHNRVRGSNLEHDPKERMLYMAFILWHETVMAVPC